MKSASDHWGTLQARSGRVAPAALRINIGTELAESRAFTEHLFRDFRKAGHRRALENLRNVDWPLQRIADRRR